MFQSDVWICMELMATCLDKLIKRIKTGIPEPVLGKLTVSIVKALNYLKEKQTIIHRGTVFYIFMFAVKRYNEVHCTFLLQMKLQVTRLK